MTRLRWYVDYPAVRHCRACAVGIVHRQWRRHAASKRHLHLVRAFRRMIAEKPDLWREVFS